MIGEVLGSSRSSGRFLGAIVSDCHSSAIWTHSACALHPTHIIGSMNKANQHDLLALTKIYWSCHGHSNWTSSTGPEVGSAWHVDYCFCHCTGPLCAKVKDARIVISRLRDITDWRVLGFELGVIERRLNAIDEDENKVTLNQGILAEEFYRMQFWWLVVLVLIMIKD